MSTAWRLTRRPKRRQPLTVVHRLRKLRPPPRSERVGERRRGGPRLKPRRPARPSVCPAVRMVRRVPCWPRPPQSDYWGGLTWKRGHTWDAWCDGGGDLPDATSVCWGGGVSRRARPSLCTGPVGTVAGGASLGVGRGTCVRCVAVSCALWQAPPSAMRVEVPCPSAFLRYEYAIFRTFWRGAIVARTAGCPLRGASGRDDRNPSRIGRRVLCANAKRMRFVPSIDRPRAPPPATPARERWLGSHRRHCCPWPPTAGMPAAQPTG